jgi:Tol biopolymer transport system component
MQQNSQSPQKKYHGMVLIAAAAIFTINFFLISCGLSTEELATQTAIAFTATAAAWTATPTPTLTSTPTPIPSPTLTPTPIGAGQKSIIYVSQKVAPSANDEYINNIYKLNLYDISAQPVNLTNSEDVNVGYYYPVWSPDGKWIVFEKYTITGVDDELDELYIMDENGQNIQKLSTVPMLQGGVRIDSILQDMFPAWSPDGTKIAFASNRGSLVTNRYNYQIFILDLNSFEIKQITHMWSSCLAPSWSPDSKKIAFMSKQSGDYDIWTINLDGSNQRQVTTNLAADRFPRWSPDGSKILFHSDRSGNVELFTVFPDGTNLTQITTNPATDATAQYSPDGNWILFQSDRDGDEELYIVSADGVQIIKLTDNNLNDFLGSWQP